MTHQLIINGMHCQACINLIAMELDDIGLKNKVKKIELLSGQNQGVVDLIGITDNELAKAKTAINNLGQYQIIP